MSLIDRHESDCICTRIERESYSQQSQYDFSLNSMYDLDDTDLFNKFRQENPNELVTPSYLTIDSTTQKLFLPEETEENTSLFGNECKGDENETYSRYLERVQLLSDMMDPEVNVFSPIDSFATLIVKVEKSIKSDDDEIHIISPYNKNGFMKRRRIEEDQE